MQNFPVNSLYFCETFAVKTTPTTIKTTVERQVVFICEFFPHCAGFGGIRYRVDVFYRTK